MVSDRANKIVALATLLTLVSAVVVPDYRYGAFSVLQKLIVHPLLFALPLSAATFRKPALLSPLAGIGWMSALLAIGGALSTFVYWLWAGEDLFDGMSIPIFAATTVFQAGVVLATAFGSWWINRPAPVSLHSVESRLQPSVLSATGSMTPSVHGLLRRLSPMRCRRQRSPAVERSCSEFYSSRSTRARR